MSQPSEQKKVNSAATDVPEKKSNVRIRSEVSAEESVLADKSGTERIARKRQRSDEITQGAEAANLEQQKEKNSAKPVEARRALQKWLSHIIKTTGKKCSFKEVKSLLSQLDDDTKETAMTTPFELMPTSIKTEVSAIYGKWFNESSDFVQIDGETANESANVIAKLSSARQSVQETIQTFKAKTVTPQVEIDVKTEVVTDQPSRMWPMMWWLFAMQWVVTSGGQNALRLKNNLAWFFKIRRV